MTERKKRLGLTPEQLARRPYGLGGSAAPALLGLGGPGNRSMLDLWSKKRRGPKLEEPPIVEDEPDEDTAEHFGRMFAQKRNPMEVGQAFESSVVALYENATGFSCVETGTIAHPTIPFIRGTPDRMVVNEAGEELHGLECKMVGRWAADRWGDEGMPGYVVAQAQWYMGVTGHDRWDCAAWIAGTEARIVPVFRDDELIDLMFELAQSFWHDHVLANEPPPPSNAADLVRFMGRRFPKDDGEIFEVDGDDELAVQVEMIARRYDRLRTSINKLEALKKEAQAKLIAIVGEHKGVKGTWGKFTYGGRAGRVSWKKIAEELAGGPVDDETLERHRGAGYRQADLRMAKNLLPWRKK